MPLFVKKNSEKGQILLVVVLASVISLTVGLAAISRSITNTRVSTEESNSQKALAAAEAGIEEQLNNITVAIPANKPISNGANFSATAVQSNQNAKDFSLNNGNPIAQDDGADIWLSDHKDFSGPKSPTMTLYWTASGTPCNDAALEVAVIYGPYLAGTGPDYNNLNMARYAADPCPSRQSGNRFNDGPTSSSRNGSRGGFYALDLPFINTGYIARVIPLYANTRIAVISDVPLPAQGYVVSSTGKSGDTVRTVRVYQGFPRLPLEFFPYNLFLP